MIWLLVFFASVSGLLKVCSASVILMNSVSAVISHNATESTVSSFHQDIYEWAVILLLSSCIGHLHGYAQVALNIYFMAPQVESELIINKEVCCQFNAPF